MVFIENRIKVCILFSAGGCGWSQYEDAGITGGSIPKPLIVNGWQARLWEFPWQV